MSELTGAEAVEEADADTRAEADNMDAEEPLEQGQVVRWYGQPGVDYREISVDDWRKAGVDIDAEAGTADMARNTGRVVRTIRWDASNDYTVPMSALAFLTEEQVAAYIGRDSRFRIEG